MTWRIWVPHLEWLGTRITFMRHATTPHLKRRTGLANQSGVWTLRSNTRLTVRAGRGGARSK